VATTTVFTIGYANYVEFAARNSRSATIEKNIPRDAYDGTSIAAYWEQRPVCIAKRLVSIVAQIGPVLAEYLFSFQIKPWVIEVISSGGGDDNSNQQVVDLEQKRQMEVNLSQKLRAALTKLGPTFIKVGQQLSIRPDLVPPTALFELQRLCDAVPPFQDKIAMKVLAQELSSLDAVSDRDENNVYDSCDSREEEEVNKIVTRVFEEMPRLVASASLGQVYKATLRSNNDDSANTLVAIKIQRPDILETVTLDLFLLISYGKVMDKLCSIFTKQTPYHEAFLNEFAHGAFMELNYRVEAANQIYFREELHSRFNSSKKKTKVIVPRVHEEFTTHRILVSDWIEGIPLAKAPNNIVQQLIPTGVELFLCQLLDIGKFHSDPHPANLYVTKTDDGTPTLCLLDFGLVANVDENARNAMTRAIVNLLQGDYDALISHDAKHLGFLPHDMDVTELKPVLTTILKRGLVEAGSNLHDRKRNLMAISNELNEVFFKYPFSVPPFFALVTRGLGLLEGIALKGDPKFDIFHASYPYAKRRAIDMLTVKDYKNISRNVLARTVTTKLWREY
jgi:aarF domain-containing kinase